MKLIIIGLVILLFIVNIHLLFKFRKEGLTGKKESGINSIYILRKEKSEVQKKREKEILNNSLLSKIENAYSKVSSFLKFETDVVPNEEKKRRDKLKGYLKFNPGSQIAFAPLKEKKMSYLPASFIKELKIVDENAGKAGTGGSSAKDSEKTDAQKASEERARLLALGDIVEVDENGPIYDVVSYTMHPSNVLEDVVKACVTNKWFTKKLTLKQKKDKSNAGKNKGLYGWSKKPLEDKPCVGFYNELDNDKKFHILVPCDDDCDQLDVEPIGTFGKNRSKYFMEKYGKYDEKTDGKTVPKEGEIFYPGNPHEQVGKVWRIKAGKGSKLSEARVNVAGNFKELKFNDEIKFVEIAKEGTSGITKVQALNECGQKKSNIDNNPCIGVVKHKGEDNYKFLYKAIGQYEPDNEIDEVYRKVGNRYTKVFKGNPLRNVSAILGEKGKIQTVETTDDTSGDVDVATGTSGEGETVEDKTEKEEEPLTAKEILDRVKRDQAIIEKQKKRKDVSYGKLNLEEEKEKLYKEQKQMAEAKKKSKSLMLTMGASSKDRAFSANYETKGSFAYWSGPYKGKSFFGTGGLESERLLPTKEWSAYRLDGPNCTTLECCKNKLQCVYSGGIIRVDPNAPWGTWTEGEKCVAQHKIKKYKWSDFKKC